MGNVGFSTYLSKIAIKIVVQQKQIENLFRKYITEYVQCQICKRQNTELVKDEKMRLWTLVCRDCKCKRTVPTIKGS
jgi:translation initiation factor 2 subunit 2